MEDYSDCTLEEMKEKLLRETSIKRSGSDTTSPPCKWRLMYGNVSEKVGEDKLANKEITQNVEPCTSQKSEETFMKDPIVIDDNMYSSQQSTAEESNETLVVCNEPTSAENYVGEGIRCYVCDKSQRRTPKKKKVLPRKCQMKLSGCVESVQGQIL